MKNRLGNKVLLHVMDEIHSKDIDWEDDFTIAEILYKQVNNIIINNMGGVILINFTDASLTNKRAA